MMQRARKCNLPNYISFVFVWPEFILLNFRKPIAEYSKERGSPRSLNPTKPLLKYYSNYRQRNRE